jgi:hypothetical protein
MDENQKQGRTNYDWVNGMRVGMIVGGVAGLLIGLVTGVVPFAFLLGGAAVGGFVGARMAQRW